MGDVPGRLSWRGVLAIVQHTLPGSALAVAISGQQAQWGWPEYLAAAQVTALQTLAWLQSKDGASNRNRPAPIRPPGWVDPNRKKFGDASMSLAETRAWLEARNGR